MGTFKSPCKTSYRSSIETIALNCLVFKKIVFLCTHFADRQTDKQTNRWTAPCIKALSLLQAAPKKLVKLVSIQYQMINI